MAIVSAVITRICCLPGGQIRKRVGRHVCAGGMPQGFHQCGGVKENQSFNEHHRGIVFQRPSSSSILSGRQFMLAMPRLKQAARRSKQSDTTPTLMSCDAHQNVVQLAYRNTMKRFSCIYLYELQTCNGHNPLFHPGGCITKFLV